MLKIIAGVLEPTEGEVIVRGNIAPLIELGAGFDLELTARENIYLNGALLGYTKEFIEEHLDEIVEFAELRDFMDMPLKNYSSGMVARIAFAIATVTEPDILIVDETLSVGDVFFQEKCERRIQSFIDSGNVTVLFVSHSIEQVERLCQSAVWIERQAAHDRAGQRGVRGIPQPVQLGAAHAVDARTFRLGGGGRAALLHHHALLQRSWLHRCGYRRHPGPVGVRLGAHLRR